MLYDHTTYLLRVETDEIIASLRTDGIVHVYILPNTHITEEVQERMLETYRKVTTISRPFIFEAGEFVSISKAARTNAIKMEDRSPVSASALIIKNLGQRILADYYYRFNRPKRPLALFKNIDAAVDWLRTIGLTDGNTQIPH